MVAMRHRRVDFGRVPARFLEPVFNDFFYNGSCISIFIREARGKVAKVLRERQEESRQFGGEENETLIRPRPTRRVCTKVKEVRRFCQKLAKGQPEEEDVNDDEDEENNDDEECNENEFNEKQNNNLISDFFFGVEDDDDSRSNDEEKPVGILL